MVDVIGAAQLLEISDWLKQSDDGPGQMGIDEWLESRGVVGFREYLEGDVLDAVAGLASRTSSTPDILQGLLMHGFFVGLEAGRRRALELQAPEVQS